METLNKREPIILFLGDILFFLIALWAALFVRYSGVSVGEIFLDHIAPFSILFVIWFVVFFIAGLYEKHTLLLKSRLPTIIFNAQVINSIFAVLFFYFVPYFSITPKTNLFLDLMFSFVLVTFWRIYLVSLLGFSRRQNAVLIGSGEEMHELKDEVNNNSRYNLKFVSSLDLDKLDGIDFEDEVLSTVYSEGVTSVVIDLKSEKVTPILPKLYNLIFSKVRFIDKYKVYEDIFDRVPLSLLKYNWFIENISSHTHMTYDFLKRAMDVGISLVLGILSLVVYPFVYLAIKLDDGGPLFFRARRIGEGNKQIEVLKFRSMSVLSRGGGVEENPEVTKVGKFLRKSRIDELPQLWNVFRGDLSLVGPRPEFPDLVKLYEEKIPYYSIRYLIKPGLSGWAQMYHEMHPHHGPDIEETKRKLSYDLYYIKNRSFLLDIKIALKTIKTLLSRSGT